MKETRDIVIIGGGYTGSLLLIHLLNKTENPLSITLVNKGFPLGKGIAYHTNNLSHLLNVRAARMSAFQNDANHFINWILNNKDLKEYHRSDLPELFLPRAIYGQYIEELLNHSIKKKKEFIDVSILTDEVIDIATNDDEYTLSFKQHTAICARKVAMCTGNQIPTAIPGLKDLQPDKRIFINPWDLSTTNDINSNDPILIIGSSLTAADTILSLLDANFNGEIYLISRHGCIPLAHPSVRPDHEHSDYHPTSDIHEVLNHLKSRIRSSTLNTHWHEPVLEEIRPHTQRIWQQISKVQKERFLRHLNHKWSLLRHRLPLQIHQKIHDLLHAGKLKLLAGSLISINTEKTVLEVTCKLRKSDQLEIIKVQRIINCTGPEGNIEKANNTLFSNLINRGLITPDEMKLGINATFNGKVIRKDQTIQPNFYVIGPALRGVLWESTAVPELRKQTEELAELLLMD